MTFWAAGAALLSTGIGAKSASKARKTQEQSVRDTNALAERTQDKAIAFQREMDGLARADRAPWLAAGTNALGQLTQRTGANGDLMRNFSMDDFQTDPGYQFRMAEGMKGITNTAAARGNLLSGAALKAASSFNQNMASNEYGNAFSRFKGNQEGQFNKLASLAGVGQVAANQNGSGAAQMGQNVGAGMMATGQYMGNNLIGAGNARASGYIAQGNNLMNGINQGVSLWNQYQQSPSQSPARMGDIWNTYTPGGTMDTNQGALTNTDWMSGIQGG